MRISVSAGPDLPARTALLAIPCYEKKTRGTARAVIDRRWKALSGGADPVLDSGDFTGKEGTQRLTYPTAGQPAERVLLVGLGATGDVDGERVRRYGGAVAAACRDGAGDPAVVLLPAEPRKLERGNAVEALAQGLALGAYRFDDYKTADNRKQRGIGEAVILTADSRALAGARKACTHGLDVAYGINLCREVSNLPGNDFGPVEFAQRARAEGRARTGLKISVLDEKALAREKMGALLGVARGSERPARLIVLDYNPRNKKQSAPLVYVGKAITFDSGGISLKPPEGMQDMKFDMCGGGAVLGAMAAIARVKPRRRVIGLIASAENMPSGRAIRPGDILKSSSGLSIEIINTDAEGRLVLADALHYAKRYEPELVIDLATLTGACVVALGSVHAGLFTRDAAIARRIQDAASSVGERFWPMPLDDEYNELIKSDVADVKNSGGRWGGAITAAAFLSRFIEGHPWAHLDIAGTSWTDKENGYLSKGATGCGVRTLVRLAEK